MSLVLDLRDARYFPATQATDQAVLPESLSRSKKLDETFSQFGLWKCRLEQATNDRSDEYGQHHAKVRPEYRLNRNRLLSIQTHRCND
jgi:hypothetical protein